MGIFDRQRSQPGLWLFAVLFVLLLAALTFLGKLPAPVLGAYLAASCTAFALYARDKRAARQDRRRVRESTLHLLGLLGGWPGAAVAQKFLRHKTQKSSFLLVYRTSVLLNCAALAVLAASRPWR